MNEKTNDCALVRNGKVKTVIDGVENEMTLEQYERMTTLVRLAKMSNLGVAYIDDKGDCKCPITLPND